ncbi:MAG: hypothetical protein AB7D39_15515 [Pseudodesulfovibrio sp.]|uniref:hypothetical protein n=1 Tax=Pseudodesulfovibrio sp. TaxID=2035812 RepID=UPI003D1122D2
MNYGRAIKYYVVYFLIFGFFAWLRFQLADMGAASRLPGYMIPGETAWIMLCIFAAMSLRLIVIKPAERFAFERSGRRWARFAMYQGVFILTACIGPIFVGAKLHSPNAWLAAFVPLALFPLILNEKREPYYLPARHAPKDGMGRPIKYSFIYMAAWITLNFAVVVFAIKILHLGLLPLTLLVLLIQYAILLSMLYRLVVTKPHSRFEGLSLRARRLRFARYAAAYVFFATIVPIVTHYAWRWRMPSHLYLELPLFLFAAMGTDVRLNRKGGGFANPFKSGRKPDDQAVRRRLDDLARDNNIRA